MQFTFSLSPVACPRCHMYFGITQDFERRMRQCGNDFQCPSGHAMFFPKSDELEKERAAMKQTAQELSATKEKLGRAEVERDKLRRSLKKLKTKTKG